MYRFSSLSYLGILCLYSLSFKFGNATPQTAPTLPPTTPAPQTTTATTVQTQPTISPTQTAETTKTPLNYTCQPDLIVLNISDDKPVGESERVYINCSNWNNRNVFFNLEISHDEDRYFTIQYLQRSGYMEVTIQTTLRILNRNTNITVKEEPYRNVTLNTIPFIINVIEMNDPPAISPSVLTTTVREDAPVGFTIGTLALSDPDIGDWGELEAYSNDIPEELRIVRAADNTLERTVSAADNTLELRTNKTLDADKYSTHSQTEDMVEFLVERGPDGPVIHFTIHVKDKPGLTSASAISLTIIDIADENPVCTKPIITVRTSVNNKDDVITNVHGNCVGGNYVNKTVSYSLVQDNCTAFRVETSGEVKMQNKISGEKISGDEIFCLLSVQAADQAVPTLSTAFLVSITLKVCPGDTDYMNVTWEFGIQGNYTFRSCPPGSNGTVKRYCDERGAYQDPVYNCTSSTIANIHDKLKRDGGSANVIEVLDTLANATSGSSTNDTLLIGDLNTISATLSIITNLITVNTTNVDQLADSYMDTVNNILKVQTTPTWKVKINQTGSGAESVLQNIDSFVEKIVSTRNTTIALPKSNLYLKIGSVKSCDKNINFPDRGADDVSKWADATQDQLVIGCSDRTIQSYSGVMYRNLSEIIPSNTNDNRSEDLQLNAPVMSFSYFPSTNGKLDSPVKIKFQLYNKQLGNARCSFWKKPISSSKGYWSEEGCRQQIDNQEKDTVVCVCDHLTNFAVLMSPSSPSEVPEDHATALSVISMTGCIISMICLFLTVAIHAYFWRVVKSLRSIIHVNLSLSLIIAYILFLSGINRTENEDVCTAMAVLIHLAFLIVFFIMMTEGCNLAYIAIQPLNTRKAYTGQPGLYLLITSYVLAVIVVAVSMGVTELEGYGNEKACWLSTETGLIWAFIVPVLVVIAINLVAVSVVIWIMCGTAAISKKSSMGRAKTAVRSILILTPIMGLTWLFGAFSVGEDTLVFQYLFAIFNSLQGLFIFICHCLMNKKIRESLRRKKPKWLTTETSTTSEKQKMKTQDTTDL